MTHPPLAPIALYAAAAVALGGCSANARPASSATAAPAQLETAGIIPMVPPVSPTAPAMPLPGADSNLHAWAGALRLEHQQIGASPEPVVASSPSPAGRAPIAPYTRAFVDGTSYRLATSPERVSDIMLQPGEVLISVAAGDTARWVIGDTASGAGAERRTHVLVKPSAVGLRTNLVISTDRRVYHVELESGARPGAARLAWSYPPDDLLAIGARTGPTPSPAAPTADIILEGLNFGYRIEGDTPPWRPLRVFDDGRQVFIEFPATIERGEVPPVFVIGASGNGELVNYRQRGRFYVVDRLFESAELRMGQRRQQVVRIMRGEAGRPARGRRS